MKVRDLVEIMPVIGFVLLFGGCFGLAIMSDNNAFDRMRDHKYSIFVHDMNINSVYCVDTFVIDNGLITFTDDKWGDKIFPLTEVKTIDKR